ncbi:hypothetical protein JZ751_005559 [Albula glossodonta]|uniref:Uncharacterized protein n=1 Tax=Albula glossodonta TaxID=121402 RepID=A0A8T2NFH3_9TELE|nr:hypothetical protein JZ751_005559 [Albula glossodonta]
MRHGETYGPVRNFSELGAENFPEIFPGGPVQWVDTGLSAPVPSLESPRTGRAACGENTSSRLRKPAPASSAEDETKRDERRDESSQGQGGQGRRSRTKLSARTKPPPD